MIDNPDQTERLLARLQAVLPLPARVTPELAATLRTKNTATAIPSTCSITWISYAGDEGGIMCRLDFARELEAATFASRSPICASTPACRSRATSPHTRNTASNVCAGSRRS